MRILIVLPLLFLYGCTTYGQLDYVTVEGERKVACKTEYFGAPSVDKYAIEYILSHCARQAVAKGHSVIDESLLTLQPTIPASPNGRTWTFEYATKLYDQGKLSDKEYGYIVAYIDLAAASSK